jgi:hypothetical protein
VSADDLGEFAFDPTFVVSVGESNGSVAMTCRRMHVDI